jgi:KDEL-tailed cysteine endopeptidase
MVPCMRGTSNGWVGMVKSIRILEKGRSVLGIFTENVNYIEASNNAVDNKLYKLGINRFADLTNEEFIAYRNKFKEHMCSSIIRTTSFKYENASAIPSTVDWRKKGAVTPVKNQGQCGKCMIFI